jgi:3-(3-hydroxy-phenyl)propionate hydroxylase
MHQPAAEPRRSIYYRYQVHDCAPPPAVAGVAPALIVGAGPIGLVTALGLAQQGVRCVLLEAERQVSEGSRAIVFTRRSMEILQQAGAADAIVRHGLPWRCGNSFYRGQQVFRMEAPHSADERFAPMTNLQQQYVEQYLLDAVARQPLIDLRWGHQVTGLLRNDSRVELSVDTPHGAYTQAADWVVAADGARSTLRALCDLKLEGAAYEGRFVIADIRVDLPLPTERLAYFDPPWNRGNTVLMHREPEGIWRIDYQLPPGETPEQALAPDSLRARIDAQLAMIGHGGAAWELDWCSVYSARALTLPDYLHGRIAFVGDAAHLLPIFGVRGANTGLQDAQNLAWKLGLTLRGLGGPGLLASYSAERVAAAREIIDEAGKSTRFMTPPTRGFRLLRDAVLSLSLTQDFVRPLYHWRTARPHVYAASVLNATDDDSTCLTNMADGPAPGSPLPNLLLADGSHLLDRLCGAAAGSFTLLVAGATPDADLLASVERWRAQGLPLQVLALADADAPSADPAAIDDADGRIVRHLGLPGPGAACLLRPDQHLCARWLRLDADRLDHALRRALASP